MVQIDEKQKAIAKIQMAVDNDAMEHCAQAAERSADFEEDNKSSPNCGQSVWAAPDNINGHTPHWIFGSPVNGKPINSRTVETDMSDALFKEFDEKLRDFLSLCLPDEAIRYEDAVLVMLNIHILLLLLIWLADPVISMCLYQVPIIGRLDRRLRYSSMQ